MASNINPYNIDGTFPIANQDNPSQGFRDNFTNIKNNFIFDENEITDLQTKAIVSQPLAGQTLINDMAGTQIRRPQLAAWTQTLLNLGSYAGNVLLDFNQANFQKIISSDSLTLEFINWPASSGAGSLGYGLMRVWISITDSAHTITTPATVSIGIDDVAGSIQNGDGTWTITFDSAGDYIFDFSSINSGESYLIFDVSRNHATLRDPMLYLNNNINPTLLVGYDGALQTALALEQGQDRVSSLGSYNSVAVGNIQLANVAYTQFDTGSIGGYSVSAARGNLTSVDDFLPVHSGDLLGYVNGIAFTGNGTANVFQQVSSIDFFATGANVAYGLGGNIAFFTADDGSSNSNTIYQAMGLENDQSARVFGNLILSNSGSTSSYVPAHNTSGGKPGQIAWDQTHFYICVGTNSWKRFDLPSTTW